MHTTRIEAMSPELLGIWRDMLEESERELGPLLHPGYVRAVSAVRPDVEVGVLERDGVVEGFLPFQRAAWDIARPVGDRLCDQSGAVLRPDGSWSPEAFAREAGLRAIRLPKTATSDPGLRPFQGPSVPSQVIDLSGGFDAYRTEKLEAGSNILKQMTRRTRKAEKDIGPMRFEWNTDDDAVFEAVLEWKSAQRRATRTPDVLQIPWARALIDQLRTADEDGFSGVVSAVWFGDTLAAGHIGVRTERVLHYWIPSYNVDLAQYSPGLICLVEVAKHAAANEGIERIDLGTGDQRFKQRISTGAKQVATATYTAGSALGAAFRTADDMRDWSRGSRVGDVVRAARRAVQRKTYAMKAAGD